ncbi:FAD-dependent pyridine nucleotide-disulfide oxidoreductase [Pseudohyphozyma bogoriensis]|nr:FAD-dependent pyridine nucleotide-disulfide oxidoreductase [Pseudohyphozyma bogoriensis]
MSTPTKNVVVVGLGAAGMGLAKALAKTLPSSHRIIAITEHNYGFFPPAALRAAVVPGWEAKNTHEIPTSLFPAGTAHLTLKATKVVKIDEATNTVEIDNPHPELGTSIPFDFIVIATGASYLYPCRPTPGATNVADVVAEFKKAQKEIEVAQSVLIVGGGATGLEYAGEVVAQYPGKEVTVRPSPLLSVVNAADKLFGNPKWSHKLGDKLAKQLAAAGVKLHLGARVEIGDLKTGAIPKTTFSVNGVDIEADYLFVAAGIKPNSGLIAEMDPSAVNQAGYIKVSPSLQLIGRPNYFAMGDVQDFPEEKALVTGAPHVGIVANNIVALIKNKDAKLKQHSAAKPIILVTFGPKGGAGQLPFGFVVGEWMAAMAKSKTLFTDKFTASFA